MMAALKLQRLRASQTFGFRPFRLLVDALEIDLAYMEHHVNYCHTEERPLSVFYLQRASAIRPHRTLEARELGEETRNRGQLNLKLTAPALQYLRARRTFGFRQCRLLTEAFEIEQACKGQRVNNATFSFKNSRPPPV